MVLDNERLIQLIKNKLSAYYQETGKNISFQRAGEEIGVKKATVCRVLQGKSFEVDTLFKIVTWLEIDINKVINFRYKELALKQTT